MPRIVSPKEEKCCGEPHPKPKKPPRTAGGKANRNSAAMRETPPEMLSENVLGEDLRSQVLKETRERRKCV